MEAQSPVLAALYRGEWPARPRRDAVNRDGRTPLAAAEQDGYIELIELLRG